jgi:hypothetical protein
MDETAIVRRTRRWIADFVIGLNLCPFARRVFEAGAIRYTVSSAKDQQSLLTDLTRELELLAATPIAKVETTLLIHPLVLTNFLEYNDFLDAAERRIDDLTLAGVIQLASFHPDYQFAGSPPDDVGNYTNRSPYPLLHLLREESVSRVAADPTELLEIPKRNVATLLSLGRDRILELHRALHEEATGP